MIAIRFDVSGLISVGCRRASRVTLDSVIVVTIFTKIILIHRSPAGAAPLKWRLLNWIKRLMATIKLINRGITGSLGPREC